MTRKPCLSVALASLSLAAAVAPVLKANDGPDARSVAPALHLNELEYLEMPGLNVMLAHDYYPEGHQGGVGIIQNGLRVATNGDIRLDRTPGQWQPVPKVGKRVVDRATGEISLRAGVPGRVEEPQGLQPGRLPRPALRLHGARAARRARPSASSSTSSSRCPTSGSARSASTWSCSRGSSSGRPARPRRRPASSRARRTARARSTRRASTRSRRSPRGSGSSIAPESDRQRMTIEDVTGGGLELVDGRGQHNNGWFVVRSLVAKGATKGAVDWLVTPHAIPGFDVGPHRPGLAGRLPPEAAEVGDRRARRPRHAAAADRRLAHHARPAPSRRRCEAPPQAWGRFLRYDYLRLDFTSVETPGHVRGELRRRAVEPVPDRRRRLRAPRLAADASSPSCRSRCATCA